MLADQHSPTFAEHPPPDALCSLRIRPVQRKPASKRKEDRAVLSGYPSPPMSSPPSPTRQSPDVSTLITSSEPYTQASTTTVGIPATTSAPSFNPPTAVPSTFAPPGYVTTSYSQPPGPPQAEAASVSSAGAVYGSSGYGSIQYATPAQPALGSSSVRGGRKSKTHVASACINCKRAHLSCDVQRPCARCVAAGKQDTCYDVAHKKRGRPRLRDESEFRLDRSMASSTGGPSLASAPLATPTRPVAPTRQRRAESFRSIQSMTSEGSTTSYDPPTPSYLPHPPPPFQAALIYQQPPPPGFSPPREHVVPTACLDLDLMFLRANRPFEQIMTGGREIAKQRLTDVVIPVDSESITAIRNRLRAEREAREPTHLPPILSTGEDPLGGVGDAEIERFTQGFSDHTYTWTRLQSTPGGNQTFPARVRLAKAATYFVVITLPSFLPVEKIQHPPPPMPYIQPAPAPYAFGPPLHHAESYMMQQRQVMQSAPPSMGYSFEPGPPPMQQPAHARTYPPPPQPLTPYPQQRQQAPPPPQYQLYQPAPVPSSRLPVAEPPSQPPPQTPQYAPLPAQQLPGPPPGMAGQQPTQLPPIAASPSTAPGPSGTGFYGAERPPAPRSSSSEEDSEGRRARSPRKRRRMGIDEVLQ